MGKRGEENMDTVQTFAEGTLTVSDIRARGLNLNGDTNPANISPYCIFYLIDAKNKKKQKFSTPTAIKPFPNDDKRRSSFITKRASIIRKVKDAGILMASNQPIKNLQDRMRPKKTASMPSLKLNATVHELPTKTSSAKESKSLAKEKKENPTEIDGKETETVGDIKEESSADTTEE